MILPHDANLPRMTFSERTSQGEGVRARLDWPLLPGEQQLDLASSQDQTPWIFKSFSKLAPPPLWLMGLHRSVQSCSASRWSDEYSYYAAGLRFLFLEKP